MAYLAAAVVVVGLLCLLDLVLSFGVIRRLRKHTELLNDLMGGDGMSPASGVPVGEAVGEFAASTIDGEAVSRELLGGPALVGFFSPGCKPCATQLPLFVERARAMPGGAQQVLAVVDADAAQVTEYVERLSPVARVVVQGHGGPSQEAFAVIGYPTLYLLDEKGTVLASGTTMSSLDGAAVDTAAV